MAANASLVDVIGDILIDQRGRVVRVSKEENIYSGCVGCVYYMKHIDIRICKENELPVEHVNADGCGKLCCQLYFIYKEVNDE